MNTKIPKRISTALLNSISAGVTPRIGLEYMAVGRKREIETLLGDLDNISEGGACCRIIVGRYGSGKSFLLQIIRNYAMEHNFVVVDADLSPERRFSGNHSQGLATYRELLRNLSTRTRPDGGALSFILERWISAVQSDVMKESGLEPDTPEFIRAVDIKIREVIGGMDNLVHGFDFAKVLSAYLNGWRCRDDNQKAAALKWLRGEYTTKSEAYAELGVRVIISDETWYDYIKIIAEFSRQLCYSGLLMLIDEGVNLYKISNTVSRNNNYEKLLTMFNDTMQGKVDGLGIYVCGTPQFVEDSRRGLFSYDALRTRLASTRFTENGMRDMQSPLMYLDKLTDEELFVLLQKVLDIHTQHYGKDPGVTQENIVAFMQEALNRIGADELLTPREIIRDFVSVLNLMEQNPGKKFEDFLSKDLFKTSIPVESHPDDRPEDDAVEFTL